MHISPFFRKQNSSANILRVRDNSPAIAVDRRWRVKWRFGGRKIYPWSGRAEGYQHCISQYVYSRQARRSWGLYLHRSFISVNCELADFLNRPCGEFLGRIPVRVFFSLSSIKSEFYIDGENFHVRAGDGCRQEKNVLSVLGAEARKLNVL